MSFYGNQYLEFKKFFYDFLFQCSGITAMNFPDGSSCIGSTGYRVEPSGPHDELIIDTANRWIRLQKNNNNHISFFHARPNPKDDVSHKDFQPIMAPAAEKRKGKLLFGDTIEIQPFRVDPAGHITNVVTNQPIVQYTLPSISFIDTDNNDDKSASGIFKILGDDWIATKADADKLIVSHKGSLKAEQEINGCKPEDEDNSYDSEGRLKEGTTLIFPTFKYDQNGHLIQSGTQNYMLPVSAGSAQFDKHTQEIEAIQTKNDEQDLSIKTLQDNVITLQSKVREDQGLLGNQADLDTVQVLVSQFDQQGREGNSLELMARIATLAGSVTSTLNTSLGEINNRLKDIDKRLTTVEEQLNN